MFHTIPQWIVTLQRMLQTIGLFILGVLALLTSGWSLAAAVGLAPWLEIGIVAADGEVVQVGMIVQLGLTTVLLATFAVLPSSLRVMRLETAHRNFNVSMQDVARAYHVAHAADRGEAFTLASEFDSVRERLAYLRRHPDLADLEPEILELAAQMSHESRDLAHTYSDQAVERARHFLTQRQQEAERFQTEVQTAHGTLHELRRWLERVEVEEAVAQAQLDRLRADLDDILPALGFRITPAAGPGDCTPALRVAAE